MTLIEQYHHIKERATITVGMIAEFSLQEEEERPWGANAQAFWSFVLC